MAETVGTLRLFRGANTGLKSLLSGFIANGGSQGLRTAAAGCDGQYRRRTARAGQGAPVLQCCVRCGAVAWQRETISLEEHPRSAHTNVNSAFRQLMCTASRIVLLVEHL
eukprot:3858699-Pleurochrysis_carterae.AAC.2